MNENPSLDCVGVMVYSQVILPVGLARHLAAVLRSGPDGIMGDECVGCFGFVIFIQPTVQPTKCEVLCDFRVVWQSPRSCKLL